MQDTSLVAPSLAISATNSPLAIPTKASKTQVADLDA